MEKIFKTLEKKGQININSLTNQQLEILMLMGYQILQNKIINKIIK